MDVDNLEKVTITTDGGKNGRGRTIIVAMTTESLLELADFAETRRVI